MGLVAPSDIMAKNNIAIPITTIRQLWSAQGTRAFESYLPTH